MKTMQLFATVYLMIATSYAQNNTLISDSINCKKVAIPAKNIIRTWNASVTFFESTKTGTITFRNDGTYSTIPVDLLGEGRQTYKITKDKIKIVNFFEGGKEQFDLSITTNKCSKMVLKDKISGLAEILLSQ